jgi:hypothetical protein
MLAVAILSGHLYARWIGWAAAASAALVLAGFVLFLSGRIALGVSLWRRADAPHNPVARAAVRREPEAVLSATDRP